MPTENEIAFIKAQLTAYNHQQTAGKIDFPGFECELAMRSASGDIVGGINVSSVLGVMFLEVLWVAGEYRKHGLARRLVWVAERLAEKAGCVGAGTWTFSFQGPEFYPRLGYELIGIYDGYPFGITEHVLMKALPDERRPARDDMHDGFALIEEPTQEDMKVVYDGFHQSCVASAGDEMHNPGIHVQLVLKDAHGTAVGGLLASTTIRIMALEHLWVDARYRGQGYGKALVKEAERIAQTKGCVAVQGTCFSFQSSGFFPEVGYERFGIANLYLDDFTEEYLIKRFK